MEQVLTPKVNQPIVALNKADLTFFSCLYDLPYMFPPIPDKDMHFHDSTIPADFGSLLS